jgi:hypothetical protein
MLSRKTLPILMTGGLILAGCNSEPAATTTTTETKTKAVGSTVESTTKTSVDAPGGDTKSVATTYLGTVTAFTPGKSIEVMTGEKDTHKVELDGERLTLVIDPTTAVGSKVLLVEEKGENGFHRVTISIAPAA